MHKTNPAFNFNVESCVFFGLGLAPMTQIKRETNNMAIKTPHGEDPASSDCEIIYDLFTEFVLALVIRAIN